MKHVTKLLTVAATITLLLTGCNESGSFSAKDKVTSTKRYLVINEETEVQNGESYIAESSDAEVVVRHALNADKKYITLISGTGYLEGEE